ncbi:persephin [Accipiter gentilis]|uniref:persephin n=1 Tax=Astur gentilis TaxID=8957 RepID=UPI0021100ACD|nr:persephin [Accipiter gentilis]
MAATPFRAAFLLLLLLLTAMAAPPQPGDTAGTPPASPPRPGGLRWAAGGPQCGLRSVAVRVRELGLGYPSEETVLFRYCGGGCPAPPTNHGLALARLRPGGGPGGAGPCCRPSRYEDVAFLDEGQHWHQLHQLSAAACRCVG